VTILECELINLRLNVNSNNSRIALKEISFNLVIEMTNVTNDSIVLHLFHVLESNNTNVSSSSNVDIDLMKNIFDSYNFITLHTGLKGTNGVNFSDIDSSPTSSHGLSTSFSNISETTNENLLSADHNISSSVDTVNKGVLAAINVIEFRFSD